MSQEDTNNPSAIVVERPYRLTSRYSLTSLAIYMVIFVAVACLGFGLRKVDPDYFFMEENPTYTAALFKVMETKELDGYSRISVKQSLFKSEYGATMESADGSFYAALASDSAYERAGLEKYCRRGCPEFVLRKNADDKWVVLTPSAVLSYPYNPLNVLAIAQKVREAILVPLSWKIDQSQADVEKRKAEMGIPVKKGEFTPKP
ncbi:hypothetical protein HNP46_005754 [Pseudomonas nitritireducens]|uniref:Uncharacterized protein n=1 Tax=Pseudomonas nitroreducens TaxID=46680 RepID=A0A7W7KQ02_PSENT|nr:hypothetical protein [Pseudomonas nitritireducens]MBB4866847.1 hypothetical protein [Pseudomonas nitritireducens]